MENFIVLQYSNTYSIISIKRSDWADEFKKLNQCEEDKLDLKLDEKIRKKYSKNLKKFIVIITTLISLLIISIIFQIVIIILPLTILLIILVLFFVGKDIEYRKKIDKMKANEYRI